MPAHHDTLPNPYTTRAVAADLAAIRNNTITPRAELAEREVLAEKNLEIAERRRTAAAAAVNRAASRLKAAEKAAASSPEGVARRRQLIDADQALYADVRAKADHLLTAIATLQDRRRAITWLLNADLAARGINTGPKPITAASHARQQITEGVAALRGLPTSTVQAIARRLAGADGYVDLELFDFTPDQLTTDDLDTLTRLLPAGIHRRWVEGPTPPTPTAAPTKKRRRKHTANDGVTVIVEG